MFGPPQPAASTNALSAVESSSTSDPSAAAQKPASASASVASNETVLITSPCAAPLPGGPAHAVILPRAAGPGDGGAHRPIDATVLLVMDVQRGIVERFADDSGYLERLAGAIAAARGAGVRWCM